VSSISNRLGGIAKNMSLVPDIGLPTHMNTCEMYHGIDPTFLSDDLIIRYIMYLFYKREFFNGSLNYFSLNCNLSNFY